MMLAHTDDGGSPYGIEQRVIGEKVTQQNGFEQGSQAEAGSNIKKIAGRDGSSDSRLSQSAATEGELLEPDPGFGLGLPGLASLTLPSESMVVPPLNFATVRISRISPRAFQAPSKAALRQVTRNSWSPAVILYC